MYVESTLPSSDAFKAVIDFAIQQPKKNCVKPGTMQTFSKGDRSVDLPCLGDGWCVSQAMVEPGIFGGSIDQDLRKKFNLPKDYQPTPSPHVTVRQVARCPCRDKSQRERDAEGMKAVLGVEEEIIPTTEMKQAREFFSKKRKSLYAQTNGFDDNRVAYYFLNGKNVRLYKGIEFANYITKAARGEIEEWKPKGTIAIIGADKIANSDFLCRSMQYLVEEAATSRFRLFVTSKLTMGEFAKRFTQTNPDGLQMMNALKKMYLLDTEPRLIQ